jgi:catechol 2,3-dioxygenase-like lactoylglutathione lyase family enzyme
MKPQPLIAVRDVEASSRWYQRLLGCESAHGGNEYERLTRDGELILQLHAWGEHDHPNLGDPDEARHGYGVLLWFETGDFEAVVKRARALKADILEERRYNTSAQQTECWLRDPDGYVVVIAGPDA